MPSGSHFWLLAQVWLSGRVIIQSVTAHKIKYRGSFVLVLGSRDVEGTGSWLLDPLLLARLTMWMQNT